VATISILTPVYNCAATLGLALRSLQAQSFVDWECIVVDDGSTDNTSAIVQAAGDSRIRLYHLDSNRGRGHARQTALELARGEYIGWLDGDDWMLPDKLMIQLDLLRREPNLAAVSTGAAIVNESLELMGVRPLANDAPVLRSRVDSVGTLPFVFPASIMRTGLAKETGFDSCYPRCEDADVVLRALFGKEYAVINLPLYAYREVGVTSLSKVISSLNACCDIYWKFRGASLSQRAAAVALSRFKQAVYCAAMASGMWSRVIACRSRMPSKSERQHYEDNLQVLMKNIAINTNQTAKASA
jgi:glycosyltransferase involved in cell wall biosynthesis